MPWPMSAVHTRISGSYLKRQVEEGGGCHTSLLSPSVLPAVVPVCGDEARREPGRGGSDFLVWACLCRNRCRTWCCPTLYIFSWDLAPPASPLPACAACQSEWQSTAGKRSVRGTQLGLPEGFLSFRLHLSVLAKRKTSTCHGWWVRENHTKSKCSLMQRAVGMGYICLGDIKREFCEMQWRNNPAFCFYSVLLSHLSIKSWRDNWIISCFS